MVPNRWTDTVGEPPVTTDEFPFARSVAPRCAAMGVAAATGFQSWATIPTDAPLPMHNTSIVAPIPPDPMSLPAPRQLTGRCSTSPPPLASSAPDFYSGGPALVAATSSHFGAFAQHGMLNNETADSANLAFPKGSAPLPPASTDSPLNSHALHGPAPDSCGIRVIDNPFGPLPPDYAAWARPDESAHNACEAPALPAFFGTAATDPRLEMLLEPGGAQDEFNSADETASGASGLGDLQRALAGSSTTDPQRELPYDVAAAIGPPAMGLYASLDPDSTAAASMPSGLVDSSVLRDYPDYPSGGGYGAASEHPSTSNTWRVGANDGIPTSAAPSPFGAWPWAERPQQHATGAQSIWAPIS